MHSPGGKVNDVLGWCELELQDAPGAINLCIIEECVTSGDLASMHTKNESADQQYGIPIVLHRSSALARASGSKRLDNLESVVNAIVPTLKIYHETDAGCHQAEVIKEDLMLCKVKLFWAYTPGTRTLCRRLRGPSNWGASQMGNQHSVF